MTRSARSPASSTRYSPQYPSEGKLNPRSPGKVVPGARRTGTGGSGRGGTKKGRAARDALEILARAASDHVDLIREVDANEAILALVGNTRVTHTAAAQLKKDRAVDEKSAKKKKSKASV